MRPDMSCPGPFGPNGDVNGSLHDLNTYFEDLPPPPIDCNINAPR